MRLLGRKPNAKRSGDQADHLRSIAASADAAPRVDRPPLVVVLGGKGGVGATTVAWQLTLALAEAGASPLAVDAHLWQPDLARVAGMPLDPGPAVLDVLSGKSKPAAAVRVGDGPALLPGDWKADPTAEDATKLGDRLRETLIDEQVKRSGLRGRFDTVVLDGGPARSPWAASLAAAADLALLVATPEQLAMLGAYSFIKQAADKGHAEAIWLTVNRCDGESQGRAAHASVRDTCRQHLETSLPLAGWLPKDARLGRVAASPVPLMRPLCRRVREAIGHEAESQQPGHAKAA